MNTTSSNPVPTPAGVHGTAANQQHKLHSDQATPCETFNTEYRNQSNQHIITFMATKHYARQAKMKPLTKKSGSLEGSLPHHE